VCVAVQLIDAPGASDEPFAGEHTSPDTLGSLTVTLPRAICPVFVATIV
jgi:hypothetical protein